jgi:hypothetical protein
LQINDTTYFRCIVRAIHGFNPLQNYRGKNCDNIGNPFLCRTFIKLRTQPEKFLGQLNQLACGQLRRSRRQTSPSRKRVTSTFN